MIGKAEWGIASLVIMAIAYAVYLIQTLKNHVQPHPFSWALFGVVTGTGYIIQVTKGAGPGSWVMGFTAAICFLLSAVTLMKGHWRWSDFDRIDWGLLIASLAVFGFYLATKTANLSACLATATDVIGYGPTIKKRWREPWGDSATAYALNSAKFIPSLFALESYSVATWLYPATLVIVNAAVAGLLLLRRRTLCEELGGFAGQERIRANSHLHH